MEKHFQVPAERLDSLKERALHPVARRDFHTFEALKGVSFDVLQGEFFGIVGRNGSGKSTLLKIIASIYQADRGTIRIAGRLAPFIELGVGFNLELTARENIILNGVMMGLPRREAGRRVDSVLAFSELEGFADLKLKNYSSGMLVRLAFSVMIQSDADVLLIDEVLAVGDAAFQQKCADVFHEMRDSGRTIVLVTHDMQAVEEYCHRAVLLDGGRLVQIGDPSEVARRYLRLNFEQPETGGEGAAGEKGAGVRLIDIWTEDASGNRITSVEQGEDIRLAAIVEADRDIPGPIFGLLISNPDGVHVFGTSTHLAENGDYAERLAAGTRAKVRARIRNPLGTGRYFVDFAVHRNYNPADNILWVSKATDIVVFGDHQFPGIVELQTELEAVQIDQ